MSRFSSLAAFSICVLVSGAVLAAPGVSVVPASIDRFDASGVEVSATGLAGSEMILRLLVDVDRDGLADPEDFPVWTAVVPDNATEWSPLMLEDANELAGAITVQPLLFTPLAYPHAVGYYLWEVEDPSDASRGSVPFVVTQLAETQAVSGRVETAGGAPIPGGMVALIPLSESCQDAELSAVADADGNYTIEFPATLPCTHRAVAPVMPGHFANLLALPAIQFTGADRFTGIDPVLTPGPHAVTGRFTYASGPRAGQGIPGLVLFAEGDTAFEIAFTGADGSYALGLATGAWSIRADSDLHGAAQGAVTDNNAELALNVAGPLSVADISHPAANAFIAGSLLDDAMNGHAAEEIQAYGEQPCSPCYGTAGFTQPDGSYVVGVVAPPSPATSGWQVEPARPLPGLVAQGLHLAVSEGETLTGADLLHLTPTSYVTGRVTDPSGIPVGDLCLRANSWTMTPLSSQARVACDGTYSIPVVDGPWNLRFEEGEFLAFYRGLDVTRLEFPVQVEGQDIADANLILGRWLGAPRLVSIDPPAAQAGAQVALFGYNFTSGASPSVTFDGVPATVVAYRPAIGRVVVTVPAGLTPGIVQVVVTDPGLGVASNELCFEVLPGSFVPACTISGNLTRNVTTPVSGALAVVLDGTTQRFLRAAVSNAAGNYTVSLDDPGASYELILIPPSNPRRVWGSYSGVSCPATQNHDFFGGRDIDGQVVDQEGRGIPNVTVEAEGSLAYSEKLTDADGLFNVRMRVPDTVRLSFFAPDGSRYMNTLPPIELMVTDNTVLPPVTLQPGVLFVGRVVDRDALGVESRIEAFERGSGVPSGIARSAACDGRFALATWPGEHRLHIGQDAAESSTEVQWLNVAADTLAEFDFTVFDDAPLQFTGPEPRIADESDALGRTGQLIKLDVENLAATGVEVRFADGGGGSVPGDETVWDPARGIVLSRVPAGAFTGDLVVRVQGVDSAPLPFRVDPGGFDPGSFTLDGTVTDGANPVPGVVVVLLLLTPGSGDCDDSSDDVLLDYAITDGSGAYSLEHSGGDLIVALLPPTASPFAPAGGELPGEAASRTGFDFVLVPGAEVSLRVVAGDPATPVHQALVMVDEPLFDQRLTDANGEATLRLPAGPLLVSLKGPYGSRLFEQQGEIDAPVALGDVPMDAGVFASGRVIDLDGLPVPGALAFASPNFGGDSLFETPVRGNGAWRGALPPGTTYTLGILSQTDDLTDSHHFDENHSNDLIFYPSDVLEPAGRIEGTILDAETSMPVFDGWVDAFEAGGDGPGAHSGAAQVCADGTYRMKLPEGEHYIWAGDSSHLRGWYSPSDPADYCELDAETVFVEQGNTESGVDVHLDLPSSISGSVRLYSDPVPSPGVTLTGERLGSCTLGSWSDPGGFYWSEVPAGTGYRVEAAAPFGFPGPSQCFDRIDGCATFTPVTAVPTFGTSGIDFVFGYPPAEVSGGPVQLVVDRTPEGAIRLTFEQLPPEQRADAYNVYGGTIGVFDTAVLTECFISPFGLLDNGDGTYSYFPSATGDSEWYLIGASNAVGESSLGPGTTLSNACGALPGGGGPM